MTPKAQFIQAMIAVNIALPLAMSYGLKLLPGSSRQVVFWICVIILFTLNQYIGHRLPDFKKWVWGMQGLNLIYTVLLGAVGVVTALSAIWLLIKLTVGTV